MGSTRTTIREPTLKQIELKAHAVGQTFHITELHATDSAEGKVSATGEFHLNPAKNYPFFLNASLDQLETVSFDMISGNFTGDLAIGGDLSSAEAKGKLTVAKASYRISEGLPTVIPELPITFIHPPEIISRKKRSSAPSSPLKLDLELDLPGKAKVTGRGLSAELKGKLHLTGSYTDIAAAGTLQLVSGEYIFSGKVFDLTHGEILFRDQPTPSAYLSLTGNCDLTDVNVTIMLQGPLTSPKLSFQSSPQLPTSSLLSQILFNKDVSEISPVQALQLAQTVISLSGNAAPDILEKIRKTLGIDRFTIVTSENDPGKISLQIGKYLMRGVLLTLSQGAESRNVSVEVDLKKGIRFQAEMNENQQGKFSLKWHHHY
jgi:translocation and assembly module TamB